MRPCISGLSGGRVPRSVSIAAVVAVAVLLAACASSDGGSGGGPCRRCSAAATTPNAGVVTVPTPKFDANYFAKTGYCPPVQIRPGTESLVVYEQGSRRRAAFVRTRPRSPRRRGNATRRRPRRCRSRSASPAASSPGRRARPAPSRCRSGSPWPGSSDNSVAVFARHFRSVRPDRAGFRRQLQPGRRPGRSSRSAPTTATSSSMSASTRASRKGAADRHAD